MRFQRLLNFKASLFLFLILFLTSSCWKNKQSDSESTEEIKEMICGQITIDYLNNLYSLNYNSRVQKLTKEGFYFIDDSAQKDSIMGKTYGKHCPWNNINIDAKNYSDNLLEFTIYTDGTLFFTTSEYESFIGIKDTLSQPDYFVAKDKYRLGDKLFKFSTTSNGDPRYIITVSKWNPSDVNE